MSEENVSKRSQMPFLTASRSAREAWMGVQREIVTSMSHLRWYVRGAEGQVAMTGGVVVEGRYRCVTFWIEEGEIDVVGI